MVRASLTQLHSHEGHSSCCPKCVFSPPVGAAGTNKGHLVLVPWQDPGLRYHFPPVLFWELALQLLGGSPAPVKDLDTAPLAGSREPVFRKDLSRHLYKGIHPALCDIVSSVELLQDLITMVAIALDKPPGTSCCIRFEGKMKLEVGTSGYILSYCPSLHHH